MARQLTCANLMGITHSNSHLNRSFIHSFTTDGFGCEKDLRISNGGTSSTQSKDSRRVIQWKWFTFSSTSMPHYITIGLWIRFIHFVTSFRADTLSLAIHYRSHVQSKKKNTLYCTYTWAILITCHLCHGLVIYCNIYSNTFLEFRFQLHLKKIFNWPFITGCELDICIKGNHFRFITMNICTPKPIRSYFQKNW